MDDEEPDRPADQTITTGQSWRRTVISAIASALTTIAGMVVYLQSVPVRDDPFRGLQGTELRRELEEKIAVSEVRLLARIKVIERDHAQFQSVHNEIWRVISGLPPDDEFDNRVGALEIWVIKRDAGYDPPR